MNTAKHRTSSKSARSPRRKRRKRPPAPRTPNTLGKGGTAKSAMTAHLTLEQIVVQKGFNPRSDIGDISILQQSIATEGLLSTLVVRPTKTPGKFSVVAGERRFRALKALKFKRTIPCIIRNDLTDDLRAKAVALMENSEDGRTNLNPIEIGRVLLEMHKNGGSVRQIAKETGIDHRKVHRCLQLMEIDPAVRKKVEDGALSMIAGLEFAKLEDKTRKKVAALVANVEEGNRLSAADIRRIRKEADNQQMVEDAATEMTSGSKSRKSLSDMSTSWRGSREKQKTITEVCHDLVQMQEEGLDPLDYDFIEMRGIAIALLWDRGDLDDFDVPAEGTKDTAEKKALIVFWKKVNGAASAYVPEEEEEVGVST